MKKLGLAIIPIFFVVSLVYASNNILPPSGPTFVQVFTPSATSPVVTISGAGNVTVSDYRVIMFDEDETVYFGSDSSNTYDLPANTPLGIASGVSTIHVSAACSMMVMRK